MRLTKIIFKEDAPIPDAFELNALDNPYKLNQSKRLSEDYFI